MHNGYVEFNPQLWYKGDSGIALERGVEVMKSISTMGYSFSHLDGRPYGLREIVSGVRSARPDVESSTLDSNIYISYGRR